MPRPGPGQAATNAASGAVLPWNPGAELALDPSWALAISGENVLANVVSNEDEHPVLAAINSTTGSVIASWAAIPTYSQVYEIASSDDGRIYTAGEFQRFDGLARNGFAAIQTSTGAVADWNPRLPEFDYGKGIVVSDRAVYITGDVTTIQGEARPGIAATNPSTGTLLPWTPLISDPTYPFPTLFLGGSGLYIVDSIRAVVEAFTVPP